RACLYTYRTRSTRLPTLFPYTTLFRSASLKKQATEEEIRDIYHHYYDKEQFVRVLDPEFCPQTKWVEGSNYVDVNVKLDPRTGRDRKSTRLNSSHVSISYAVFCLKQKI